MEIDHAERLYEEGEERYWGVRLRGSSAFEGVGVVGGVGHVVAG